MLEKTFEAIRQAYSGQAAKEDVAAIIRHHRIQASPGYRAAADYVLAELLAAGLEARIERFPADYQTRFWTLPSFEEWEATEATLHLIEPAEEARKLADYRELKISLIQRGAPFEGEAEVVLLEDGLKKADYQGREVEGKIVLTRGSVERVRQLAVEEYGAIGILFDGMRQAPPVRQTMDLPDARQYTSFWWQGLPGEKQCFGFVLSPRQGEWLRRLIRRREAEGKAPVRVRAMVKSRFYAGQMEVVTALIPGRQREKSLLVSHLCHPQPSANDNASGVAANLEAARTLQRLISAGDLPRPKRTIQFLWMPEMTGSYAYLSHHEGEIADMIAGLNLDMVGEDQSRTGSVLLLERPPDAAASFAPDLLAHLQEMALKDVKTYNGLEGYSLVRWATTSFSGGSDHYVFSDPAVGVPMPMLIQWPDKFYHTSADTLEKVDPQSLARSGAMAAAYAYFIASAGQPEVAWLAHEMHTRFQARLGRLVQDRLAQWLSESDLDPAGLSNEPALERRVAYALARHHQAMLTLNRLWDGADSLVEELTADASETADREVARAYKAVNMVPPANEGGLVAGDEWEQKAAQMIPRRLYRGPAMPLNATTGLPPAERAAWQQLLEDRSESAYTVYVLAEYWVDGQRTALDIVDLVEMETGVRDAELIVRRLELLERQGLVTFNETAPT
jgi:aminopeptidase YwaD